MSFHVPDYAIKDEMRYTIISDHLGSVRQVIHSQTGAIVQAQSFDAFGNIDNQLGVQMVPFGFAGGLMDQDTGLIRFGARDYDPATGRWTSKDPIRFDGDGVNLYRYANNDPVNLIDPVGTQSYDPILSAVIAESINRQEPEKVLNTLTKVGDTALDAAKLAAFLAANSPSSLSSAAITNAVLQSILIPNGDTPERLKNGGSCSGK